MTKCHTVIVKFFDRNRPAEEVRALQVTAAKHLNVLYDDKFVSVAFISSFGLIIKVICYNINDVKEFACEGVFIEESK